MLYHAYRWIVFRSSVLRTVSAVADLCVRSLRKLCVDRMSRLGWTQGKISETIGLSRNRVSEIIGNTNFGNIDNLLSQSRSMEYIARHYNMDLLHGK